MNNETKILSILEVMQEDLSGVKQDVSGLKQDVSELKQEMKDVKQDLKNLEQKVTYLSEDVDIVRLVVVKNEHELGNVQTILREGFYDNEKLAKNYEPRISTLEDTVDTRVVEVDFLKSKY